MNKYFIYPVLLCALVVFLANCSPKSNIGISQNSINKPLNMTYESPNKNDAVTEKPIEIGFYTTYRDFIGNCSKEKECVLEMNFKANGEASKSLEIKNVEKKFWKGHLSPKSFDEFSKKIIENTIFKDWIPVDMAISNSKITLITNESTKVAMSNVDQTTTTFISLMNEFKKLEKDIEWKP